jgi:hypothetical protein
MYDFGLRIMVAIQTFMLVFCAVAILVGIASLIF